MFIYTLLLPRHSGSGALSNRVCLESPRIITPNRTSIRSAVLHSTTKKNFFNGFELLCAYLLLPARMLPAGIVCGGVCLWVCVSVRRKSRKLLVGNRCNLVGICPMGDAKSDWKLVTFDLDLWPWELFSYFLKIQAIYFEWLDLATSFSVWRHIFRISRLVSRS